MRHPSLAAILLLGLILGAAPLVAGESTRTLRLSLPPDTPRFSVENLAGTMTVVPGGESGIEAVAIVHAESEELAGRVRFERLTGEGGAPLLRVRYPLDSHPTIRYAPDSSHARGSGGLIARLFGGQNRSQTEYDGRRARVSSDEGVGIHVDLEIRIPTRDLEASFRNVVGRLTADGVRGRLRFHSSSGEVAIRGLIGTVETATGSGSVRASGIEGSFACRAGSGDCELEGFRGDTVNCGVGSGDIRIRTASARRIEVDTGSGDIRISDSDLEELDSDTGSGSLFLETGSDRLIRVRADAGSGKITLRLPEEASFEALADQGSGDIRVAFDDAQPIRRGRDVVGYRRGEPRLRIEVNTGSGDLIIQPAR
jgi:hypothetical protein